MTQRATEIIDELRAEELETLRAERDQARADLRATERECAILRSVTSPKPGVGANIGKRIPTLTYDHDPHQERMEMLENAVRVLDAALYDIGHRHERCDREDWRDENEGLCDCAPCEARRALDQVADWRYGGTKEQPANRYHGAYPERLRYENNPREVKIHAAWAKYVFDDFKLAQILRDNHPAPSARDWYVATSVVQWLATNIGSQVLEAAGFAYQFYDEDFRAFCERQREEQRKAFPQGFETANKPSP